MCAPTAWARNNTRLRLDRDHRYGYSYLIGAACAAGWEWLRAMPEQVASILRCEWGATAEAAH